MVVVFRAVGGIRFRRRETRCGVYPFYPPFLSPFLSFYEGRTLHDVYPFLPSSLQASSRERDSLYSTLLYPDVLFFLFSPFFLPIERSFTTAHAERGSLVLFENVYFTLVYFTLL